MNALPSRAATQLCLSVAIALVASPLCNAQSATLRFANNSHPDIPLQSTADVVLQSNGNYEARCVLASGTTRCQGTTSSGSTGPQPGASISGASAATTGAALAITRTTSNSPELCVATATPSTGVTGWSGAVGPTAGTSSVTFANTGSYTLGMRCYNAHGATSSNTLNVNVTAGSGTPGNCPITHPQIRPQGMTEYAMTWQQVFDRSFPNAPGYLTPLGSFTPQRSMAGPLSRSMYLAIPFVAEARLNVRLNLAASQPIAILGYDQYRRGAAFITVSPCAGDFRPPAPESTDLILRNCRRVFTTEGVFSFGNVPSPSASYCQLTAGQTYYLNVVMAPPGSVDGFTDSCEGSLERCEVNAQPSAVRIP